MAYSSVGKPRFYIPLTELFYYNGALTVTSDVIDNAQSAGYLNPSRTFTFSDDVSDSNVGIDFDFGTPVNDLFGDKGFVAILGHNFKSNNISYYVQNTNGETGFTEVDVINAVPTGGGASSVTPDYDGFSICTFDATAETSGATSIKIRFDGASQSTTFGSIVMGRYFDMPVNPDLKLSMVRDYSGIKKTMTKSGATLSNAGYIRPASWNGGNAWELGGGNYANARTGRRIWSLNYSFLSDHEVFSPNEIANTYIDPNAVGDYEDADVNTANTPYHNYNIGSDDSFYSRVINPSVGGHLPFIFNPVGASGSGQDNSPSNFAIARFDQKNFKFTQSMHKKYTFNTKIMESW